MDDGLLWLTRLLGVFYLAGGVLVLRTLAAAAAAGKMHDPEERTRARYLGWGAVLTGMGGAALVSDSALALPVFLANGAVQGAFLLHGRSAPPPKDDAEAVGRRRAWNAFVGWAVITALIGWLVFDQRFVGFLDPLRGGLVAAVGMFLAAWWRLRGSVARAAAGAREP